MRQAVNSGSALRTNPVHISPSATESRRRAEPRVWNLVFSNRHGGSILTEGPGADYIGRMRFRQTTNIGQRRIVTYRRRVAVRGRDPMERLRGRDRISSQSSESR
jgi:hypothetical protein